MNGTDLQSQIAGYLEYLKDYHGFSVSIHLSAAYTFEHEKIVLLKKYNIHTNPYCFYIKNILGAIGECIGCQQEILEQCQTSEHFLASCHADVLQYIHRICAGEKAIGFICVSGYRSPGIARTEAKYLECLSEATVPAALLDVLIPPLAQMLSAVLQDVPPSDGAEIFPKILRFLQNDPNASLAELAEAVGCSCSYISHMFRRKSGTTLKEYCNRMKIEQAKLLLETTELRITDIALSCGFNHFSYFISVFRNYTGQTPRAWRKEKARKENTVFND